MGQSSAVAECLRTGNVGCGAESVQIPLLFSDCEPEAKPSTFCWTYLALQNSVVIKCRGVFLV